MSGMGGLDPTKLRYAHALFNYDKFTKVFLS